MRSCSPLAGGQRRGCGSGHPVGAGSWAALRGPLAGPVLPTQRKVAAVGPSAPPTGHHDSCVALMTSYLLSGSHLGSQAPGEGRQDRPADWDSWGSSCLGAPATKPPENLQGLTALSEGACWAERWAPARWTLQPPCVHGRRGRETDCLGQWDGVQDQGTALRWHHCTDCMSPAGLKRVLSHPLAAAAAVVAVGQHERVRHTLIHGAWMEGNRHFPWDACSSKTNNNLKEKSEVKPKLDLNGQK